jgi:TP901 family phage tail tape measure protein
MSDVDLVYKATLDGSGFSSGASGIISQLGMMGSAAGAATVGIAALAAGVIAAGVAIGAAVAAASSWESAMTGVARTTGLAGEDLKGLSDELIAMSQQMPTAASELASIAQVAGSLGVAKENIAGFTEVVAKMAVGFEMSAEQAATSSAKILTAFGQDITAGNMEKLGNTVNRMGDSYAATETQVLDFTSRASILNTTFGLSIPQVAAWGTALISSGMEAENAATGINSMMNMALDPKKFDAFAKAAGMSTQELRERLNKDVAGTFELVAKNIASGTDSVANFQTVTDLVGTEGMKVFQKMAGATYQGAEALALANAEWETGTSLTDTYNAALDDMGSQMQILKNNLYAVGVGIGDIFLPSVTKALSSINELGPGITTSLSSIAEKIRAGDIKGALDELYSGIDTGLRSIGSRIVDYFKSIDYKAIGYTLRDTLISAWDFAVGLFKSALGQGDSLVGVFSALGDILRPTFEHIFSSLQIAGLKAAMAIGEAMTTLANTIAQAFTTAINWVLDRLADLADAIDSVTGGAASKISSMFSMGGSPTTRLGDVTNIKQIVPEGTYTIGEKTWSGADIIDQWSSKSEKQAMIDKYDVVRIASAAGSESAIQTLRTQSVVNEMYTPLPEGTESVDIWGGKAPATSKPPSDEEIAMHERGTDTLANLITESSDIQGKAGEAIRALKTTYVDNQPFAESDKGKLIQSQIDLLEAQKAAERTLKENGLEDTKAAKELEKTIEATGEKVAAEIAASVSGVADALYDPMYKASFQGQTKDYGPTAQENMQRQAEAALVNAQYGIVAVGSMNEYTQYAKERLAAAGIEQISVKSLIDDAIAGLKEEKSTVDDTIASTNDLKAASKEVDFAEAKAGAEDLKSTCVEVEFSMENIAATASQIKFSRSASASPDALKQGIFETSDTDPRTSQPQMAGANAAAGGLSNAALSAMQRYLSQVANNTNRIYNGINTYGRSIFSAVQLAGTNAAAAVNANGSNIASTVNSQGGAIVGAINAGVAALIKVLSDKGSGNMGGPHAGMGGLGSVGSVWDGLNPSAGSLALEYGIFETAYSEGGYASRPTIALVGDSPGGEFMVPRDRVGEFVNSYMSHQQTKIDGSGMRSQLMDAVGSLNVPAIHIPVVVDIDSEAIFEAVEYAFKSISSDIRLRARV